MADYKEILRHYWGYDSFRGIQEKIISSIESGKDTLGLMPTGGGKSITFQVPALAHKGTCLVISPLIALMKDQVDGLRDRGIQAYALYSGQSHGEVMKILENCILGDIRLLYVSPERLKSELFLSKLKRMRISFITVDEAHCISQWGYDFRPDYLKIAEIRKLLPNIPVLALTATATPKVVEDIQDKLEFREKNVFSMSFMRQNLSYIVRRTDNKKEEMTHILNKVAGSAIVYVRSRGRAKELADYLVENAINASFYHAGLDTATREKRQEEWQSGEKRVIVATNAFGMGIDKTDVRMVIHYDSPSNLEAYLVISLVMWMVVSYFVYRHESVIDELNDTENEEEEEADLDLHSCQLPPEVSESVRKLFDEEKVFLNPRLKLSDVARKVGTNRTYLSRFFNQENGYTFYDYVNQLRVKHAERLLSNTNLPISLIADQSGFNSLSTFRRVFNSYYQCSPQEYRTRKK